MDWLRRIVGRPPLMVVDLSDLRRVVKVVGESHHQVDLLAINGGYTSSTNDRDPSMPPEPDSVSRLIAEHDNESDPLAVAVEINGRPVGHLAREDAAVYQPIVLKIEGGGHRAICLSRIVGGYVMADGSRAYFGAELFLCSREAAAGREPIEARVTRDYRPS